jgi:hypothetical protein
MKSRSKNSSTESKSSPKTAEKPAIESKFLKKWNSLPNLTKHKPSTKTYKTSISYIVSLKRGKFFEKVKLDKDFLYKNNIPTAEIKSRKWTDKEVYTVFERFSASHVQGNYPKNKGFLPKSLEQFLFNSHKGNGYKGTSLFLTVAYDSNFGLPLAETEREKIVDPDPFCTRHFLPLFKRELSTAEKQKLFTNVKKMMKFCEEALRVNVGGRPHVLCQRFAEFFNDKYYWMEDGIHISMIVVGGKVWREFLEWLHEYRGYPFLEWFDSWEAGKIKYDPNDKYENYFVTGTRDDDDEDYDFEEEAIREDLERNLYWDEIYG